MNEITTQRLHCKITELLALIMSYYISGCDIVKVFSLLYIHIFVFCTSICFGNRLFFIHSGIIKIQYEYNLWSPSPIIRLFVPLTTLKVKFTIVHKRIPFFNFFAARRVTVYFWKCLQM